MLGILRIEHGFCGDQIPFPRRSKTPAALLQKTRAGRVYGSKLALDGHGPVVVAVRAMRMVQVAIHEIVDMVPMGNRRVTAIRTVNVIIRVSTAVMAGRAGARIGRANG